jgi:hypothetical protein
MKKVVTAQGVNGAKAIKYWKRRKIASSHWCGTCNNSGISND